MSHHLRGLHIHNIIHDSMVIDVSDLGPSSFAEMVWEYAAVFYSLGRTRQTGLRGCRYFAQEGFLSAAKRSPIEALCVDMEAMIDGVAQKLSELPLQPEPFIVDDFSPLTAEPKELKKWP